ncbi:hypothetical protein AWC28_16235 [Mycolicibacter terrae]|nr:hypothetical protein AWC28_16235 [Mycolicibacter terrae]
MRMLLEHNAIDDTAAATVRQSQCVTGITQFVQQGLSIFTFQFFHSKSPEIAPSLRVRQSADSSTMA